MNPKIIMLIAIACLILGASIWYFKSVKKQHACIKPQDQHALRLHMRKLWEDHVAYSRNMFEAILDNKGDRAAVINRLMHNQDDTGNALKPFYGQEIGNKFAQLLREHIHLAVEIVQDAKDNNTSKSVQDRALWFANADETAQFLSEINPHFSREDLQRRLRAHLVSAEGEVAARIRGDWAKNIDFYDQGLEDMRKLGDLLAEGIIKQFPNICK